MTEPGSDSQSSRRLAISLALVVAVSILSGGALGFIDRVGTGSPAEESSASDQLTTQVGQSTPFVENRTLASADAAFVGTGANDTAGWSTASGDVNGDGVLDLVVGAPRNGSSASNAGAVYVFYGPTTAETVSLAEADATLLGESAGDWAGWTVATGDLHADGTDEVIVGAPRADANGSNAGAVYVLNGSAIGNGTTSLGAAGAKLAGRAPGDHAGWAVDVLTNVSADGTSGIVVGAPYANTTAPRAGAAFLVSAPLLSGTVSLTNATATFYGTGGEDLTGWSVASAGDTNGDGVSDLLVGAPRNDDGGNDSGVVYLVADQRFGVSILDSANRTLAGAGPEDLAGYSVATSDLNDDGIQDLVIGAPLNDSTGTDAGTAYVVRGSPFEEGETSLANADRLLAGEGAGDRAGWSVGTVPGNLSCDGVGDVLVGAPYNDTTNQNAGAAYVVAGNDSGYQNLGVATKLAGQGAGDRAGHWVASTDATGDGVGDVLVAAPYNDSGGLDAGATYLAFGQCPEPKTTTVTATVTPTRTTTATATKTATATRTPKATKTPGPIATPTKTATPKPKPRTTTPGHIATPTPHRTTRPTGVEVRFLDCDAVEVTGNYGAVRLVVVGGPPQVFDATEGPTFQTEGGQTIAVVQVLDSEGNLIGVVPRPGGVGDCVRRAGAGHRGNGPPDDAPNEGVDGDSQGDDDSGESKRGDEDDKQKGQREGNDERGEDNDDADGKNEDDSKDEDDSEGEDDSKGEDGEDGGDDENGDD